MQDQPNKPLNVLLTQFAYRSGISTEAALHSAVRRIEEMVYNKKFALAFFFDIEGAFSDISFNSIRRAMRRCGVEDTTARWIMSIFQSQIVTAKMGQTEVAQHIRRVVHHKVGCYLRSSLTWSWMIC